MATYYVSSTGNDSNDGLSQSSAWLTVGEIYNHSYAAGDSILLEGGQVFTGLIYLDNTNCAGTVGDPVTISSYGSGRATVQNTAGTTIYLYNIGGIEIENLILSGVNELSNAYNTNKQGISLYNDTASRFEHIYIDNVDISYFTQGISMGGWPTAGYSDVRITNSVLHNNKKLGISTYGYEPINQLSPVYANANVYVGGVTVHTTKGDPDDLVVNSGSGIVLGSVDGGLIENCTAYNNGELCAATNGPCGIWTYDSNNVVIQKCLSYGNKTGGTADGIGFDLDQNTTNCTLQYNLAYDNDGPGILVCGTASSSLNYGNTVRYNVTWRNSRRNGSYAELSYYVPGGTLSNSNVYNNTFIAFDNGANVSPVVYVEGGMSNVAFRNNVFLHTDNETCVQATTAYAAGQALFQGNSYQSAGSYIRWGGSTYADLSSWQIATNQEKVTGTPVGVAGDPMLVSPLTSPGVTDYASITSVTNVMLQAGSPLIGTGLDLNAGFGINPGSRDYFGQTIAAPYSIGAHHASKQSGWTLRAIAFGTN